MADNDTAGDIELVATGAALFIVGRIVSNLSNFGLNLALTRHLSVAEFGQFSYGRTIIMMVSVIALFGIDKSLMKFIPNVESAERDRIFTFLFGLALFFTSLVSFLIFILAPTISKYTLSDPGFTPILRIFSAILFLQTILKSIDGYLRSVSKPRLQVLISQLLKPSSQLLFVGVGVLLSFSVYKIVGTFIVGTAVASAISIILVRKYTGLRLTMPSISEERVSLFKFSIPMVLKEVGSFMYSRIDLLMVGIFLSSSSVGIYQIVILLTSLLTLPLAGINQLFPSVISKRYDENDTEGIHLIYTTVARWIFTVSAFSGFVLVFFRVEILSLFGSDFIAGSTIMVLFVLGQLVNSTAGPVAHVLLMTGHEKIIPINQWAFGLTNIGLNYIFIHRYGLIGAALATAGVYAGLNIVRVIELQYFEGLQPFTRSFIKPLLALGVAAGVMVVMSTVFSGLTLLFAGTLFGGLTYLAFIYLLGIEDIDYQLANEIRP